MEKPSEAIDETLALLAAELAPEGFRLRGKQTLSRKRGDFTDKIVTQGDKWNRAGVQAIFRVSGWLESARSGKWARSQEHPRLKATHPYASKVSVRQLGLNRSGHHHDFDALEPKNRAAIASQLAGLIRDDLISWFEAMSDPLHALAQISDIHVKSRLQFAVAAGHEQAAREWIERIAADSEPFRETVERIRSEGMPRAFGNGPDEIASWAVAAGLI